MTRKRTNRGGSPRRPYTTGPQPIKIKNGVGCPVCHQRVQRGFLREHLIRAHGRVPRELRESKQSPRIAGSDSLQPAHAGDQTIEVTSAGVAKDGSAGLSSFARERGRFGSHPEFDGDD